METGEQDWASFVKQNQRRHGQRHQPQLLIRLWFDKTLCSWKKHTKGQEQRQSLKRANSSVLKLQRMQAASEF